MSDDIKLLIAERDQLRQLASDEAAMIRRLLQCFEWRSLPDADLAELGALKARLMALVPAEAPMPEGIDGVARCKGCKVWVAWRENPTSRVLTPYDIEGGQVSTTNHFITCPQRDQFRRTKKKGAKG